MRPTLVQAPGEVDLVEEDSGMENAQAPVVASGFRSPEELFRLMTKVDLTSEAFRRRFSSWRFNDGSREGLLSIIQDQETSNHEVRRLTYWLMSNCAGVVDMSGGPVDVVIYLLERYVLPRLKEPVKKWVVITGGSGVVLDVVDSLEDAIRLAGEDDWWFEVPEKVVFSAANLKGVKVVSSVLHAAGYVAEKKAFSA